MGLSNQSVISIRMWQLENILSSLARRGGDNPDLEERARLMWLEIVRLSLYPSES